MNFLMVLIVMGAIGVIGTVEYAYAELTASYRIDNCSNLIIYGNTDTIFVSNSGSDNTIFVELFYPVHNRNWQVVSHVSAWIEPQTNGYFEVTLSTLTNPGFIQVFNKTFIENGTNYQHSGTGFQDWFENNNTRISIKQWQINENHQPPISELKEIYFDLSIGKTSENGPFCFYPRNEAPPTITEPPKTRLQLANEKIERLERILNSTNTPNQDNSQLVSELRSQLNTYRQQLDEKDDIISNLTSTNTEQQKKIDKQRKNIANKKATLDEKNFDSDRLLYLESTMKMLINYFNITYPIKTTSDTNTTDNQLQTRFNTLQSSYNTLESNYSTLETNYNTTKSELSNIRSRFNTIESLYNSTIITLNEKQYEIDKLTRELNNATKRIEELESRDSQLQFQGSSNDEETNNEQNNNPVELPTTSITLPESMSLDNTDRTIDLYTYGTNNIRIDTYYPDTGTKYHINDKADITIFRDTEITNRQFIATNQDSYCYVGDLIVGQDPSIPISVQHTNSIQLQFRESDDPTRCDQAPNILFNDKLELNKEVYVRFVGTDGQIPFYYTNEIYQVKYIFSNYNG